MFIVLTVRVSDTDPDWIRIPSGQKIHEGKNDPQN
jgi:hypothetical protein